MTTEHQAPLKVLLVIGAVLTASGIMRLIVQWPDHHVNGVVSLILGLAAFATSAWLRQRNRDS